MKSERPVEETAQQDRTVSGHLPQEVTQVSPNRVVDVLCGIGQFRRGIIELPPFEYSTRDSQGLTCEEGVECRQEPLPPDLRLRSRLRSPEKLLFDTEFQISTIAAGLTPLLLALQSHRITPYAGAAGEYQRLSTLAPAETAYVPNRAANVALAGRQEGALGAIMEVLPRIPSLTSFFNFSGRMEAASGLPPDQIPEDARFAEAGTR